MPTENRRIATYFPKDIDDKFTAFKLSRGIRGDSQALLTIVSEFLGVIQEETHFSLPDLIIRIESLEKVIFKQEGSQVLSTSKFSYEPESQESVQQSIPIVAPGQLSILEPVIESSTSVDLSNQITIDLPSRITGSELSKRLGLTSKVLSDRRRKRTDAVFIEWSRELDPDGIGWQYDLEKKVYFSVYSVQEIPMDCQDF